MAALRGATQLNSRIGDQRYHSPMPDTPSPGFPPVPGQPGLPIPPTAPVSWHPTRALRRPSRWPMLIAIASLCGTVVAVGIALAAWLRPGPENRPPPAPHAPVFTDEQIAGAKSTMCAAYATVHGAVGVNTSRNEGNDPTSTLAVLANARLAIYGGGGYLFTKLAEEPATPPSLASAIRTLANAYQDVAIGYMADLQKTDLDASLRAADNATISIEQQCK